MRLLALEPTSVEKRAAALRNVSKRSPMCCGGGFLAAAFPFLLSLSPDGLKVKDCSPPSLGLSSSFKESLCERNAWRDHLLSNENKSCAETQQALPVVKIINPFRIYLRFPVIIVYAGLLIRWRKSVLSVSGVSVRVYMSEEAAVGLSKSPDALVWKL